MKTISVLLGSIIIVIGCISSRYQSNAVLVVDMILTAMVAVFLPKRNLLPLASLLIAPNRLLTLEFISAPLVVVCIGFIRYVLQRRIPIKILDIALFYVCFSIITCLLFGTNIILAIKTVIIVIFLYYAFIALKCNNISTVVEFISLGCIITTLFSMLITPELLYEGDRMAFTSSGQNVLGLICGAMAVILFSQIVSTRKKFKLSIIVLGLLIVIGFLTGSRTFLLEVGVGVTIYSISSLFHRENNNFIIVLLIFLVLGLLFYFIFKYSNFFSNSLESSLYRIDKTNQNDISNGRFEIWQLYFNEFMNNINSLCFGGVNYNSNGIDMMAHNMIIEQLAAIGIVGTLIVFILYKRAFLGILNALGLNFKFSLGKSSPLLAFLIASMVGHSLLGLPQTIILFVCLLNLTTPKYEKNSLGNISRASNSK